MLLPDGVIRVDQIVHKKGKHFQQSVRAGLNRLREQRLLHFFSPPSELLAACGVGVDELYER